MNYYLAAIMLFISTSLAALTPPHYIRYENALFNYQIFYPDFLNHVPQHLGDNKQRFINKEVSMEVLAQFAKAPIGDKATYTDLIKRYYQEKTNALKQQNYTIDASKLIINGYWLMASNAKHSIYYKSVLVAPCGVHLLLQITYPKTNPDHWQTIIANISNSFSYSSKHCVGNYENFMY